MKHLFLLLAIAALTSCKRDSVPLVEKQKRAMLDNFNDLFFVKEGDLCFAIYDGHRSAAMVEISCSMAGLIDTQQAEVPYKGRFDRTDF